MAICGSEYGKDTQLSLSFPSPSQKHAFAGIQTQDLLLQQSQSITVGVSVVRKKLVGQTMIGEKT